MSYWKVAILDKDGRLQRRSEHWLKKKRDAYYKANGHYIHAPKQADFLAELLDDGLDVQVEKMRGDK